MRTKTFRLYNSTEATARQFTDVVIEHINNGETEGYVNVHISDNLYFELGTSYGERLRHLCNKILAEATGNENASLLIDLSEESVGWLGTYYRCPKSVRMYFNKDSILLDECETIEHYESTGV